MTMKVVSASGDDSLPTSALQMTNFVNADNYRKRLSDTWWLLSMRLRTRLGHGQYLFLC